MQSSTYYITPPPKVIHADQNKTYAQVGREIYLFDQKVHLLHNKPRCVINDIKECKIIELLRDRNKATVTNYLYRLENRSEIILVCMVM